MYKTCFERGKPRMKCARDKIWLYIESDTKKRIHGRDVEPE